MATTTQLNTNATCPYPLLPKSQYPERGGDTNARFCVDIPALQIPDCCLPCPKQNFFYRDEFTTMIHATTYVNLVGIACCCFMLLSFAVLPVEATRRHYLSVCLAFAVLLMQMSFVIPLGNPKNQCYDAVTPHDMYSSLNCALSGAFLLGGGWCVVMWVFLRTLSLHLQICWQVVPGRKFFLGSQLLGWSIPVIFLSIALSMTGVSFRFGESCHINSKNGVKTFWGPMLAMAAASIVTQSITFGYVMQVYIRSLFEDKPSGSHHTGTSGQFPGNSNSNNNSVRTITATRALRRIKRVIELQWRGIFIVVIILADVIYFSTVFLQFDGTTQKTDANVQKGIEWLFCVLNHHGDKNQCLDIAAKLVVNEATAFSVLFLLSFNGIWALLLLGRFSIYPAWWKLIKDLFHKRNGNDEFVSYNARRISDNHGAGLSPSSPSSSSYEMLESKNNPSKTHSTATDMSLNLIMKPEPILTPSSARDFSTLGSLREYNPQTFTAQLRGTNQNLDHDDHLGIGGAYAYRDLESGHATIRTPLYPGYGAVAKDEENRFPIGLSPTPPHHDQRHFEGYGYQNGRSSDASPKYPKEVRIGVAK